MPTIVLNIKDLFQQVKIPLSKERLIDLLSSIKCEYESQTEEELTVEVNSDRPDLFSSEGIARALRSYINGSVSYVAERYSGVPLVLRVEPATADVRPLIVCAAIRGIHLTSEVTKQLMQLQEKLHNTYAASRRKASIGVYDLDKVEPSFLYTALPPSNISFVPLDCTAPMGGREILEETPKGKDYAGILAGRSKYPLLLDAKGTVLSMPPIINSEETRVTEDSKNLLIDVTGLDEKSINTCLNIMVTSILERGGSLQTVRICYPDREIMTPALDARFQSLSVERVNSISGLKLKRDEVISLLNRMGFQSKLIENGLLQVEIPAFRVDILHDVDLVEDALIAYGLNRVTPEVPNVMTMGKLLQGSRLSRRTRDLMIGAGFQEVASYVLSNRDVMEAKSLLMPRSLVEIVKPISSEYTVLRDSILPKLLQFLGCNTHMPYPQRIFEYGEVVRPSGSLTPNSISLAAAVSDYRISFEEIQAVASALFRNLSKEAVFSSHIEPTFIEGRTAKIYVDGKEIGLIGEINPQVLSNFGIVCPTAAFECNMSAFQSLESLFRG